MFKTNKINCTIEPKKFESLNNGIWYYNYDIESEIILDNEEITRYNYGLVRISGSPTVAKCYEALLKAYKNEEHTSLADVLASPTKTIEDEEFAKELYESIEIDFGIRTKLTELEIEKRKIIRAIDNYDISQEVNSFFLNGLLVWLDKSTRVGLMNSLNIEKTAGKEISTLWFGNLKLEINTDTAILMLSSLELYALECYNKTAEHKVIVESLDNIDSIRNYDYTTGYPDKLTFTI